jgi:hypothetical protein
MMTARLELSVTVRPMSADLGGARRRNRLWLDDHHLLGGRRERARYDSWALPDLIGLSFPDAHGADLDLLVDILGWYTVFDDSFDGPAGRSPDHARAVVAPLLAIMGFGAEGYAAGPGDESLTEAWRDLWHRQVRGASPAWRGRAAADWRSCLRTVIRECVHRHRGTLPTPAEAVRLRRDASCLYPFMNMLEPSARMPGALVTEAAHRRLRAHIADTATYINDLYSLEREERLGDVHNMVLIVQRHQRISRDDAVRRVGARVRELVGECGRLSEQLAAARPAARPYLDGLRTLIDGVYRWTSTSRRYDESRTSA